MGFLLQEERKAPAQEEGVWNAPSTAPVGNMPHIGAISGGKDSVCMAFKLKQLYPEINFTWVCTPTGNEPAAWFAHMRKLQTKIGPIQPIIYPGGLAGLVERWNALPNHRQRWCTRVLKIEPFAAYLMRASPAVFYVGLRADEEEREGGDYLGVPNVEMRFPLRELGMDEAAVWAFLADIGEEIPARTDCKLCFFQRLIEWWALWHDDLPSYLEGEAWEAATGHTFRSVGRDSWPTALKDLRAQFEAGWVPKETRRDRMNEMQCRVCRQ